MIPEHPPKLLSSVAGTDAHKSGCYTEAELQTVIWNPSNPFSIVTKDMTDKNNSIRYVHKGKVTHGYQRGGLVLCAVKSLWGAYQSLHV